MGREASPFGAKSVNVICGSVFDTEFLGSLYSCCGSDCKEIWRAWSAWGNPLPDNPVLVVALTNPKPLTAADDVLKFPHGKEPLLRELRNRSVEPSNTPMMITRMTGLRMHAPMGSKPTSAIIQLVPRQIVGFFKSAGLGSSRAASPLPTTIFTGTYTQAIACNPIGTMFFTIPNVGVHAGGDSRRYLEWSRTGTVTWNADPNVLVKPQSWRNPGLLPADATETLPETHHRIPSARLKCLVGSSAEVQSRATKRL